MSRKTCASSDRPTCWNEINFRRAEASVKKLQRRIYAACEQGNADKVDTLTHKMLHSYYAKACAVKHVCSTDGKNTAGVDGVLWESDRDKFNAISSLRLRGYKPKPLKRVYKEEHGHRRPLGIPTMKDRAMQTLYRYALEPVAEFHADEHSYGYRHGRSVRDAILQLTTDLSENPESVWILKADIESCFDNISHEWLLKHIQVCPELLRKFLKAGYLERGAWYPTEKGVPQGGSVSSTICNLTLNSLEERCNDVACVYDTRHIDVIPYIRFVRYADDFIVASDRFSYLLREVVPTVENFLKERGLVLSQEKTVINNINDGFEFLGWEIFREDGQVKRIPSQKGINSLFDKVAYILSRDTVSDRKKATWLKHVIAGWVNFYSIASYPFFNEIEFDLTIFVNQSCGSRYLAKSINKIFQRWEGKNRW